MWGFLSSLYFPKLIELELQGEEIVHIQAKIQDAMSLDDSCGGRGSCHSQKSREELRYRYLSDCEVQVGLLVMSFLGYSVTSISGDLNG